ncbi:MAG: tol-pal system protein YbgF [bacterium]
MRPSFGKIIFSLLLSTCFASPLRAASGDIEQLKQDVSLIKTSVENSNVKLAEAMNQLMTLQQEINTIKGVSESGGHFYEEQNRALREYDQRITALEDKISTLMALLKEIKDNAGSTAAPKTAGVDETQTREFQRLLDNVNASDYAKAIGGFQAFLQKYPKSPLAENAQYWLAESYYGLNDFKKAISEYQVLIQKYPRSSKTKAALYKQGLSFYGLKMYNEARPFFEKVTTDYPNTSEAAKASAKIQEINRMLSAAPAAGAAPSAGVPPPPSPPSAPGMPPAAASPTTRPAPPPPQRPVSGGIYD